MVNERVKKSPSWTPQPEAKSSLFASPPIPVPAQAPTPQEIEHQAFMENKREALGLQLQAKDGTITPQGQEHLTLLQAKRDALQRDQLKSLPDHSLLNIPNLFVPREIPQPIQPKLKIEKVGDQQEVEQVAAKALRKKNTPQAGEIIQRMHTSSGEKNQGQNQPGRSRQNQTPSNQQGGGSQNTRNRSNNPSGQPSKNKAPLKAGSSRTGGDTSPVPSPQSGTSQTQTTNPFLQKYQPKVRDKSGALGYESVGSVTAGPKPLSEPKQPENKIGYVINMAAVPGEETPGKVAQTYYEQGFDNEPEVVKRLGMVMGVNKYRSIDGRSHSLVAAHMKQAGNPEFMVRVFGFTWELVEWVDTTTNTVANIDTVSKDFKNDLQLNAQQQQEVLATEKSYLGQSTIPYGLIREKITASSPTKELVKTLGKYNKHVYIHLGDADALSLSAPENQSPSQQQNAENKPKSLFSRYDEILEENQHPLMAVGGYDFRYESDGGDLDSANPRERLTYLANQLDIAARKAIASIVPEAVYPTEPNLVFLAQGPNNSNDLFSLDLFKDSGEVKTDKSGELYGRGPREGRKFQKNLLEASKNQYDTKEIIYAPEASVATSSQRFKLTDKQVAKQQESLNKGVNEFKKQIIQDVIGQTQSFLSASTFALEVLSSPTAKINNKSPFKAPLVNEYTQRIGRNILGFLNKATTSNRSSFKAPDQNQKVTIVANIINAVEAELNKPEYQWIWDDLQTVIDALQKNYKQNRQSRSEPKGK